MKISKPTLIYIKDYLKVLSQEKYETIEVESEKRQGYFHKVVKDLETGKAISCSCGCWSRGNKACAAMRSVGV